AIGATAVGESFDRAIIQREAVDLRVVGVIFVVVVAIGGDQKKLGVRRPACRTGIDAGTAEMKVASSDLPGCSTFRRDDEYMGIAGLKVAGGIEPVNRFVVYNRGLRPLCAGRRFGHLHQLDGFRGNKASKGYFFAI